MPSLPWPYLLATSQKQENAQRYCYISRDIHSDQLPNISANLIVKSLSQINQRFIYPKSAKSSVALNGNFLSVAEPRIPRYFLDALWICAGVKVIPGILSEVKVAEFIGIANVS